MELVEGINSVTKQSDTNCHSEPCPESKRRSSEESKQIASLGYVVSPIGSGIKREGSQETGVLRDDNGNPVEPKGIADLNKFDIAPHLL